MGNQIRFGGSIFLAALAFSTSALISAQEPEDLTEICIACHDDKMDPMLAGSHRLSMRTKIATGYQGCQACHWPGDAHVEDPNLMNMFGFRDEPVGERSERCLACHRSLGVSHSLHQRGGLACDQCHGSGHGEKLDLRTRLLDQPQPDLCLNCHSTQRTQMQLPFRHRTSEGVLLCTDCHNPHSRQTRRARRALGRESCFRCHTDKQGPFVFEHLSSTITGCESCHEPHGSTNPRLLIRSEVRFLCLECHAEVPSFHDLSLSRYQNCILCHTAIHGSYVNRSLLR